MEALRDRGVEAFGLDISEYAIGQVREDIRQYCRVSSALEPFPRRYDLIVCLEVLEHLIRTDAESAVVNLCKYSDDIILSSTPDDLTDATHLNVQPVEYWAELFAEQGFYRNVDYDAAFIAKHAILFRKVTGPVCSVVKDYERKIWAQSKEVDAKRLLNLELAREKQRLEAQLAETSQEKQHLEAQLLEAGQVRQHLETQLLEASQVRQRLEAQLLEAGQVRQHLEAQLLEASQESYRLNEYIIGIENSVTWILMGKIKHVLLLLAPLHSSRERLFKMLLRVLKVALMQGYGVLLQKAATKLRNKFGFTIFLKSSSTTFDTFSNGKPSRSWGSRALLISGSGGNMERFRCNHTQEQFQLYGIHCDLHHFSDTTLQHIVSDYDLLIIHRVPHSASIENIVRAARTHKVFVLFDIDDLVFDPEIVGQIDALHYMDQGQQAQYINGIHMYKRTLEICDGALVPTDYLVQAIGKLGKQAWIHRNALSVELINISTEAYRNSKRNTDKLVIGYASGTRTHNRDFKEVEIALERILHNYPQVELWIIGYLDLDENWDKWRHRIKNIPFAPWRELPRLLAQMDINLAPLEAGNPFCQAKSELKYFEAAAVKVPTVASKIGAFEFAIHHDENGLLAEDDDAWFKALEQLITNQDFRLAIGESAYTDVLQRYHPSTRGAELLATLDDMYEKLCGMLPYSKPRNIRQKHVNKKPVKPRIFKEHALAHTLLDGQTGLEIGAAAHNPFGLQTRNVAIQEGYEFYAEHQRHEMGVEPTPIDIPASADDIPVPNGSEDFITSSHVVEHLPNLIATFQEWDRIVRGGGYVFMIVPLKVALVQDVSRPLTTLEHFVEDYNLGMTLDTHPVEGVPGGKMGHYHTFTPDSLIEVVQWMHKNKLCDWKLVAREDIDSKVGNGFTLAFKVRH